MTNDLRTLGRAMRDAQRAFVKQAVGLSVVEAAESAFDAALANEPAPQGDNAGLIERLRSPATVFYEYAADGGALLRDAAAALEAAEARADHGWIDGAPPKPWSEEWFIAETDFGPMVLRALPEEYTFDFKTADETYIKADKIKRWMQLPDSEYKAPTAPQGDNAGLIAEAKAEAEAVEKGGPLWGLDHTAALFRRLAAALEAAEAREAATAADLVRANDALYAAERKLAEAREAVRKYDEAMEAIGGCGDGYCVVVKPVGQHTNGGCRCMRDNIKGQRFARAANALRAALTDKGK